MRCLICKYLNTREEARKHLNKQTILILGQAHKNLAVSMIEVVPTTLNCNIHNDTKTAANHLVNASEFSNELKALVQLFPNGVPERPLQTLLNKYPDPRK
jgi:hypothetical protein